MEEEEKEEEEEEEEDEEGGESSRKVCICVCVRGCTRMSGDAPLLVATFWPSLSRHCPEPTDSFPSFLFPFSKGAHFL